jgi:hypothetical protein
VAVRAVTPRMVVELTDQVKATPEMTLPEPSLATAEACCV